MNHKLWFIIIMTHSIPIKATEVIKKDHQKSINSASTASSNRKESGSFLKNIFNTSNSIYTEKHEKKFGSSSDKNKKHRKIR